MTQKIIITGSEGIIGQVFCENLDGFEIYKIDNAVKPGKKSFQADISNYTALSSVFDQIPKTNILIHLAADARVDAPWESVLKNNIEGTKNIYECARKNEIKKVVFASSNHVTGAYEGFPPTLHRKRSGNLIKTEDMIRPDSHYGTSKAFGEALARQYFELHGINSICLRIGTVRKDDNPTKDKTGRCLSTWLSHRDLIQLIKKSVNSQINFGVYYGVSNNKYKFWDTSNAKKEINYEPIDDASSYIGTEL